MIKSVEELLQKYKLPIGILLAGLALIGVGIGGLRYSELEPAPKVEVLEAGVIEPDAENIVVEISGEVINPGVYTLEPGSRVNDLLIIAGGFSAKADREWVGKNINLAQKLIDGAKIFVPGINKINSTGQISNDQPSGVIMTKININNASMAELDTLWGIGEATARKIIEARPYQRPEELLEKKIVKSNVWERIKDQVTVY